MPETRIFNESVFASYANLQDFFNRSRSIQKVLSKKGEPYSGIPIPINAHLNCQWQVCQLATQPFRLILAVFLTTVAVGLDRCHFSQAAKNMKNWSVHLIVGFNSFSNETTKVLKVASTLNSPNKNGKIVNEHPSIPESRLDASVRARTFCSIHKAVKFDHNQGICRGMSYWFLYLYLQTKEQFSDPRAHMAALAKQFKNGGGMDPTLLQSIFLGTGNLLNLKIGTQSAAETDYTKLFEHTPNEWRSSSDAIIGQLKTLPVGAYAVGLPKHQTGFIKINDKLGYFFDPNYGVMEIQGHELAEKLYEKVSHTLKETSGSSNTGHVDFMPITLRSQSP